MSDTNLILLGSVGCFYSPDTGNTYQSFNGKADISNPVHLSEIEVPDWFKKLSKEDIETLSGWPETEEQFDMLELEANTLVKDAAWGGNMFETYGKEVEYVWANKERAVTIVAEGNSLQYINGFWRFNRLGYLLLKTPIPWEFCIDVEQVEEHDEDE